MLSCLTQSCFSPYFCKTQKICFLLTPSQSTHPQGHPSPQTPAHTVPAELLRKAPSGPPPATGSCWLSLVSHGLAHIRPLTNGFSSDNRSPRLVCDPGWNKIDRTNRNLSKVTAATKNERQSHPKIPSVLCTIHNIGTRCRNQVTPPSPITHSGREGTADHSNERNAQAHVCKGTDTHTPPASLQH